MFVFMFTQYSAGYAGIDPFGICERPWAPSPSKTHLKHQRAIFHERHVLHECLDSVVYHFEDSEITMHVHIYVHIYAVATQRFLYIYFYIGYPMNTIN